MREGDIAWLGLAQANRDPRRFERPDEFVIDRTFKKHLGFGAGAHRCLGAHLARVELIIVLEEWLQRIPDFRLATDEQIMERGGQLMLLTSPWSGSPERSSHAGTKTRWRRSPKSTKEACTRSPMATAVSSARLATRRTPSTPSSSTKATT